MRTFSRVPRAVALFAFAMTLIVLTQVQSADAQVNVTVRVVDQFGAELAGSIINVPGHGAIVSGSSADLDLGNHTFTFQPATGGIVAIGRLVRSETAEVTATTTEIAFEWKTTPVTFQLFDQHGVEIVGSKFSGIYISALSRPKAVARRSRPRRCRGDRHAWPGSS